MLTIYAEALLKEIDRCFSEIWTRLASLVEALPISLFDSMEANFLPGALSNLGLEGQSEDLYGAWTRICYNLRHTSRFRASLNWRTAHIITLAFERAKASEQSAMLFKLFQYVTRCVWLEPASGLFDFFFRILLSKDARTTHPLDGSQECLRPALFTTVAGRDMIAVVVNEIRGALSQADLSPELRNYLESYIGLAGPVVASGSTDHAHMRFCTSVWLFQHWLQVPSDPAFLALSDSIASILVTPISDSASTTDRSARLDFISTGYLFIEDVKLRRGFTETFLALWLHSEPGSLDPEVFLRTAQRLTPEERNGWLDSLMAYLQDTKPGEHTWAAALVTANLMMQLKGAGKPFQSWSDLLTSC
jgi:hypothetical protein